MTDLHFTLFQIEMLRNKANSGSAGYRSGSTTSESMKKRIVSIGKQPKVSSHASSSSSSSANKKKRTMVSELFDSLTPAAEYFAEGSRRRRALPKNYNEHEKVWGFFNFSTVFNFEFFSRWMRKTSCRSYKASMIRRAAIVQLTFNRMNKAYITTRQEIHGKANLRRRNGLAKIRNLITVAVIMMTTLHTILIRTRIGL